MISRLRHKATLQECLSPHCLPFAAELHRRRLGQLAVMVTASGRFHFGVIGTHPEVDEEEVWIDAGGACPMSTARKWRFTGDEPVEKIARFASIREARRRVRGRGDARRWKRRAIYAVDARDAVDELEAGHYAAR